jgi:hypothetical protein
MPLQIPRTPLTAHQLDLQCPLVMSDWIDIYSERAKELDDDHQLTLKWLKIGVDAGFMFVDNQGRIFGRSEGNKWYPYHFEAYGKKYGYKVSSLAAN